MPGAAPLVDRIELDDVDLLREVTHPVRGAVLRRLRTPLTVAELAALMDVPVTRLYHHVNKLADLGLIQVVATRQVAAVTERRYQVMARSFELATELFETADRRELAFALGSLFDIAKLGLQRSVEAGLDAERMEEHVVLSLGELRLSDARRAELLRRLEELADEFRSDRSVDDADGSAVSLFVAAYPETP